jgi:HK97 family phage prohead protease
MHHKQLEITPTETDQDQGTFTALVSAWSVDRQGDVIDRHAFDRTIEAWQQSGKRLPLLFEHSTEEIGSIDPFSIYPTEEGLVVSGEIDRSTEHGRQVWRSIKRNSAAFSIGYMSEDRPRRGGGRRLLEIDLLEITATSKPAHPATRALSWKSLKDDWEAWAKSLPAAAQQDDCPPELVGTAWDPVIADGSPVQTSRRRPIREMSTEELTAYADSLVKDVDTRPVHVAEFEVD